jgi:hypothetical protein
MKFVDWKLAAVIAMSVVINTAGMAQQTRYWVGTGPATLDWNSNANWSAISGGTGNASFPVAGDIAIFDGGVGASNADCQFSASVSVATLTLNGYTGTLSQGAFDLAVSAKMTVTTGTFTGSTNAITMGSFLQNGGTFTSTSGTLTISGNTDFTSGSFNANGGTISFYIPAGGSDIQITGTPTLNNIILVSKDYSAKHTIVNDLVTSGFTIDNSNNGFITLNVSAGITVNGAFIIDGANFYVIYGNTIYAKGDILLKAQVANDISVPTAPPIITLATIVINGAGVQNLTSTVSFGNCMLPNVVISKPSGTLKLDGMITAGALWTYTSGTIVPGSSTVYFYQQPGADAITISGTHTLNNVVFVPYYSTMTVNNNLTTADLTLDATNNSLTLAVNNTITVNGQLSWVGPMTGSSNFIFINTGTVYAKGDMSLAANYSGTGGGTASIEISGTGTQVVTGNATLGRCVIPPVTINKPSGIITLSNFITAEGNWNYLQGTVNASTNSTVYLLNNTGANAILDGQGISSTMAFNNLQIRNANKLFTLAGPLDVDGNLTIDPTTTLDTSPTNYSINIGGNLLTNGIFTPNNSAVTFDGTVNQSVSSNNSIIYNLTINKPGGSLVLLKPLAVKTAGALVLVKGTITTTATNILTLNSGAATTIGNATSYIDGPMNYVVATAVSTTVNLPLGSGIDWRAAELTVKHVNATPYTYTAQMINTSAYALGYTLPATIKYVSGKRYWKIVRSSPNANLTSASVKLYFNTDDEVNNLAKLGVAKNIPPATVWTDVTTGGSSSGNSGTPYMTGNITSGTVTTTFPGLFSITDLNSPAGVDNPLPIELSSFTVANQRGHALLNWETKTEKSNDYFVIERSRDGHVFEEVDRVPGAGTSLVATYYTWRDKNILSENNYYRLRQTDFDGAFSFSNTMKVNKIKSTESTLIIYPLPISNSMMYFSETSSVIIVNATGYKLSSHENVDYVDVSNLVRGLYFVIDQYGESHKITIN